MNTPMTLLLLALALGAATAVGAAPVLMISIDGLRPADVLDAPARGLRVPNLQRLAHAGAYATGVRNVLPTVTYPNHTTLVTGVWPARHGIASNLTFDPLRQNMEGWYWYAADIKVPTLWDAVHAHGGKVASLGWPVTVGDASIDYDIPEYWRAKTPDDLKLTRQLVTPGLLEEIHADGGPTLAEFTGFETNTDEAKSQAAASIYRLKKPVFFTLHLSSLDNYQHIYGPGSPEAHATLERIDAAVGALVAAARAAEPDLVVAIVSDHGFAPVEHDIDLGAAFVDAGLITLGPNGKPVAWEAAVWPSGGSAAVVLARPEDDALRARVEALLRRLAADPDSGIGAVANRAQIAAMGGAPDADVFVDGKIGYTFGSRLTGPLVVAGTEKGTHGYFPTHPEMRSTLILEGPGVGPRGSLGEVDMRDIAPTLAKIIGVPLPTAEGRPLL